MSTLRFVRDVIKRHQMVDHLHLSDVLIAPRNAGYSVDRKTGLLPSKDLSGVTRFRLRASIVSRYGCATCSL